MTPACQRCPAASHLTLHHAVETCSALLCSSCAGSGLLQQQLHRNIMFVHISRRSCPSAAGGSAAGGFGAQLLHIQNHRFRCCECMSLLLQGGGAQLLHLQWLRFHGGDGALPQVRVRQGKQDKHSRTHWHAKSVRDANTRRHLAGSPGLATLTPRDVLCNSCRSLSSIRPSRSWTSCCTPCAPFSTASIPAAACVVVVPGACAALPHAQALRTHRVKRAWASHSKCVKCVKHNCASAGARQHQFGCWDVCTDFWSVCCGRMPTVKPSDLRAAGRSRRPSRWWWWARCSPPRSTSASRTSSTRRWAAK